LRTFNNHVLIRRLSRIQRMEFSEPTGGITVGPILLGASKPAHILTQTATVRGILNMMALAAVDAAHTGVRAMTRIAAE
jgi:hypothetical protein